MSREKAVWKAYACPVVDGVQVNIHSVVIPAVLNPGTSNKRNVEVIFTDQDARRTVEEMLRFLGIKPETVEGL